MPAHPADAPVSWREHYLTESPRALRRLVLLLYLLVTPPFVAVLAGLTPDGSRTLPVLLVVLLCSTAALWVAVRRVPTPGDWVYPGAIAPVLSCGVAYAATGTTAPAFLAVMGAPVAWAAVLFTGPTVVAAWLTATATCFVAQAANGPLPAAAGNALVFGVIQGLVAWVVHGRATPYREARLRSLERRLNDIELMMMLDGRIVLANDRAVAAYGWSREELLRMRVGELREEAGLAAAQMASVVETGALTFQAWHVRRDGTRFPVEVSSRLCTVGSERFLHSVIRDITPQREHERSLENALAAEKRFLATMSHEIRTPLNGIVGYLDLLSQSDDHDGFRRDWVVQAQIAARHLMTLINDILDVSKLDAGQFDLASEPFELGEVIGECIAIVSPLVRRGVDLSVAPHAAGPPLLGDATRVRQILVNILGNAAKFTERGAIHLRTSVEATADGRACIRIDVEDTGLGIAAEELLEVFEQFRQAHGARYSGAGMGLFLARTLARRMGGDVTATSQIGAGSMFRVELSLALAGEPIGPTPGGPTRTSRAPGQVGPMHVLVVDDVPMNVMLIEAMLGALPGTTCDVASDGVTAVERVGERNYDLVLMDIQMPVMDGIEATRRIRARGLTMPVIAVTASAMGEEVLRALEAGMNGVLPKPIRLSDVASLLLAYGAPPNGASIGADGRGPRPTGEVSRRQARTYFQEAVGPEAADELLETAVSSLSAALAELRAARARGEAVVIVKALHRIRGTLLGSGLTGLAAETASLEHAAPGTTDPDGLDALESGLDAFLAG